jgi:soluble lytic murein transglycosylase
MLNALPLLLILAVPADPRPRLVTLELAGRTHDALTGVEQETAERPAASRQLGLDFLRGHLLEQLGRPADAVTAFGDAISATPKLAFHCRYRLASEQIRLGHPEVAAGLLATGIAAEPASPLAPEAVRRLIEALNLGGDCRLLRGFRMRLLATPERRSMQLAAAECDLRGGASQAARGLLVALLDENHEDDVARLAAARLAGLAGDSERGRIPLLLSMAFFEHRDFARSVHQLAQIFAAVGVKGHSPSAHELAEARYALGRADFWQGRFEPAARTFGEVAETAPGTSERARALLQQGRSYEMLGDWKRAVASFRQSFLAEPGGEWAAPALLSALRLEWRSGEETTGAAILAMLSSSPKWRDSARRAVLFLAASDLVRARADRAGAWLDRAAAGSAEEEQCEIAYWRGRLAELRGDLPAAIDAYLNALQADPYHPLSRAARTRLAIEPLASAGHAAGRRLAGSRHTQDLYNAWLLLGADDLAGRAAEKRLRTALLADAGAAPFLRMEEVPVERWPLWTATLRRPEEILLALGVWHEGAPALRDHFPPAEPALALTGSLLMARNGETARSIQLVEALRDRVPARLPLALLPPVFHRCLFPFAYREPLLAESRLRGVDPYLLAALIRVESRFDHLALSSGAARGLTQFVLATASHVAATLGMDRLEANDLYRPEVAIDLGGAYLAQLLRTFRGTPHIAIAAYDAGESQAVLWRTYCFSPEPEEYFTKVGFRETRLHLARVLGAWAEYQRLYG